MHVPMVVKPSEVRKVTGLLSRTRAYELEKSDPNFPKRIYVGGVSGWRAEELLEYFESCKKTEASK